MTAPQLTALHVGKFYPPVPGGMERYLQALLEALAGLGVRSTALVHRQPPALASRDEPAAAGRPRVLRVACWGTLLFAPLSPAFPWRLRSLLREEEPDLLHLPNPSAFWALLLPAARQRPWVIHWHADVPEQSEHRWLRLAYRLYRPLERLLLKRAAAVIATSPPYADSSPRLREVAQKCVLIPLGLAPPARERQPREPAHDGPLRVLAVGRLSYYKGFAVLLAALREHPGLSLDLVGDGEERPRLEQLAADPALAGRVTLHGAVSDAALARLYENCDCLCLPSLERAEAFGMVLLEAMARGRPCVVTDVPGTGMAWVVEQERSGLVVPPADPAALGDALSRLADDRALLARLGEAARARFDAEFHIDASAQQVRALYRRLAAGRTAHG
jgi:rhamnosyl/mannosyltransferase